MARTVLAEIQQASNLEARDYYKALTVKLDKKRYENLKSIGLKLDKRSQEIFVEALDLWLRTATAKRSS